MRILSGFSRQFERQYVKYKLFLSIKRQVEIRLILGAGGTSFEGFVSTDLPQLNICVRASFETFLRPGTVGIFVAEHVFEHLSNEEGARAFGNCFEFLRPGGALRIAVPDGFHPNADYIASVKPGGCGPGADEHKVLYNYHTLTKLLEDAGYRVKLLEWFDENGEFQYDNWKVEDGFIERSTRFDSRNGVNPTAYTSLIVDARKPLIPGCY